MNRATALHGGNERGTGEVYRTGSRRGPPTSRAMKALLRVRPNPLTCAAPQTSGERSCASDLLS